MDAWIVEAGIYYERGGIVWKEKSKEQRAGKKQ